MAALLRDNETIIVEDDGLGEIAERPPASLGGRFPDRTVHIRSFSKSFGPDLRLAVLSAPSKIADGIQAYRNFGAGWTSRILQATAAFLLCDPATEQQLAVAKETYKQRRRGLVLALSRHGVNLPGPAGEDGLCVWVPVESERFALVTLAARGIAVHPGDRFYQNVIPHIRVGTGLPIANIDDVAKAIALACGRKAGRDRGNS